MKKQLISHRVENMQASGIRAFFDLVLGMKEVISLGIGEPDFVTPWHIRESAIFSIEEGYTSYTSNKGLVKLRTYVAAELKKRFGLVYDIEEEILITVGVSEALDLAARSIINPGDKILVCSPSYVSYAPVVELAGGQPKIVPLSPRNGFKLTPQDLKESMDSDVKGIILNYPSNPTGVSYTKGELAGLHRVLRKYGVIVISDEIYDDLTYDFRHTPYATLKGAKDTTVYLNGFSKTFAMTGWRIGFACGPPQIIQAMTKIHQYTMLCAPVVSQLAACEALFGPRKPMEEMKREYHRRRDYVVDRLNAMGLTCRRPEGAFYVFPSIQKTRLDSVGFASRLLKKKKVAVVPGTAFGKEGEGYIRISYASSIDNLKEALNRMEDFLK